MRPSSATCCRVGACSFFVDFFLLGFLSRHARLAPKTYEFFVPDAEHVVQRGHFNKKIDGHCVIETEIRERAWCRKKTDRIIYAAAGGGGEWGAK